MINVTIEFEGYLMKKVCIIGCFAIGHDMTDGQTIKTKTVHEELVKEFGKENVLQIDTYGRIITFFKIPFLVLKALLSSENIVILPGENGLRIIAPLLACFNIFFKRKIVYDVIGGWLPEFVENRFFLIMCLKQFDAIFVETKSMKEKLIEMRFLNIDIVPNCKKLNICCGQAFL